MFFYHKGSAKFFAGQRDFVMITGIFVAVYEDIFDLAEREDMKRLVGSGAE